MRQPPVFLMTDPAHYAVSYEINPWMRPQVWDADPEAHLLQAKDLWRKLRGAIEGEGGVVHVGLGAAAMPDMVFPANAAIVLNGRALLAKFRHSERAKEEAPVREVFDGLRRAGIVREVTANPGIVQEGAGDCIWDSRRRIFWAGSGPRSSHLAAPMIADHFGEEVVSLPLATDRYYHLDTCFCPLSGGEILYYPPAIEPVGLRRLRDRVPAELLIEASAEDAQKFCVNAVGLGHTLVMSAPSAGLARGLVERGYRVVGVDVSPFILSGGGAFCMTLRLDLGSTTIAESEASTPSARQLDEVTS